MKPIAPILLAIISTYGLPVRADDFHLGIDGRNIPELKITERLGATYPTIRVRTAEEELRHETFLTMVRTESLEISISNLKAGINPRSNPKPRVGWTGLVAKELAEDIRNLDSELLDSARISAFNLNLAKSAMADGKRALRELEKLPASTRAIERESSGEK
jgi:hypothetical protein